MLKFLKALRISREIWWFFQANALRALKVLEGSGGQVMRHGSPADVAGFQEEALRRKSSGLTGLPQQTYTPDSSLQWIARNPAGF